MISREGALDVAGQRLELGRWLDHVGQLARSARPGRAPRRRSRRAAPAASPGRGCGSSRPGPSASGRRRRRRRRRRARRAPGSSSSGSREATMTSIRSPESTSLTSLIERSWPTASGVSVSGKVTISRSGSTGSASGSGWPCARGSPASTSGVSTTSIVGPPSTRRVALGHQLYSSVSIGTRRVASAARAKRQLDPQHAVLVGRLGLLGVDVDPQLDDAAERARSGSRPAGRRGPPSPAPGARR